MRDYFENKTVDETLNDLKNAFNNFYNSNKEAYYNFMEFVAYSEEKIKYLNKCIRFQQTT